MTEENLKHIACAVGAEINRQDVKWGDQRSNPGPLWTAILGEEYGEVCKAVLEHDVTEARKELIQVAAVCYQIIDAIDSGRFETR